MFITIGNMTINTDHITDINWAGVSYRRIRGKSESTPCVYVCLSTVSNDGDDVSPSSIKLEHYEAARLATWFKSVATDLNQMTPDADALARYPKAETPEPVSTYQDEDVIPF